MTSSSDSSVHPRDASDGAAPAWTPEDSSELYGVENWGIGYFSIGKRGQVLAHPSRRADEAIDMEELIEQLQERGISLPILLRFGGILEDRIHQIQGVFARAIEDHGYRGRYTTLYPIKVNQQRQVVEEIQRFGEPLGNAFGLEAGSKAELLAVLAVADDETPIVCNGFKDEEYIETVLLAQKIGRQILPVVERALELELILKYARIHDIRPRLGVRLKLATRGAGRWKESAGYNSKFGLTVRQAIAALERLRGEGCADGLKLLHYHMGSQITNIRQIKSAVAEISRVYVELVRLGAGLEMLDVGGGLGVDYDGTQSDRESSINYTLQEYANDVVYHVMQVCDEVEVPHPVIVTESGRALTAHHSVLVFDVLGTNADRASAIPEDVPENAEQPVLDLIETYRSLDSQDLRESYHDAEQALEEALNLFALGYLPLPDRALAEAIYWEICRHVGGRLDELPFVPEELEKLDRLVAETYFCNFSLFQSLPDSWAIDQLFPVMPIHRHLEQPDVHAILADISCDSDGKIDHFIGRPPRDTLPLHDPGDRPYYLGIFLIGAYQEILGDLHNLFGDTNAVHVSYEPGVGAVIEDVVEGDRVDEVLQYVQFDTADLLRRFRRDVERAVRDGKISARESGQLLRFYEAGLQGYTYLEGPAED